MQDFLRVLKLTLSPPPLSKRKRRNDELEPETSLHDERSRYVHRPNWNHSSNGYLYHEADQAKAAGKREMKTGGIGQRLKEILSNRYVTFRYHYLPPPLQDLFPAPCDSSIIDLCQSQSPSQFQPQQLARSLSRATSTSSRTGTLNARSLSRASTSQSRCRSGSVELDPDARSRSRSRSVSFVARSAGGIRAPVKAGVKPTGGKAKPKQLSAAPSAGPSKLSRISAPVTESQSQSQSQKTQSIVLVAETPQKPTRTMSREVSVGGTSFMQRLQGHGVVRKVSLDKSAFEEFMVSSPERLGSSDFDFGDLALETPRR